MSINYIIVSYPGKTKSRFADPYSDEILDIHMKYLHAILKKKQALGIKNEIAQITLISSRVKPDDYQNYYRIDKWRKMFQGAEQPMTKSFQGAEQPMTKSFQGAEQPIKFCVLEWAGSNNHYSYDKFLLAISHYKEIPYNILIEDDYFIDLSNPWFDLELMEKYKKSFPLNFGYLCTFAPKNDKGQKTVASIANGFISTFSVIARRQELDGTTPKTQIERYYEEQEFCQIAFGNIFMPYLDDLSDEYYLPFWLGLEGQLQDFTITHPNKKMFMPIQLCKEIRDKIISIDQEKIEKAKNTARLNAEYIEKFKTDKESEIFTELDVVEQLIPTELEIAERSVPTELEIAERSVPTELEVVKQPVPTKLEVAKQTELDVVEQPVPTELDVVEQPVPTELDTSD